MNLLSSFNLCATWPMDNQYYDQHLWCLSKLFGSIGYKVGVGTRLCSFQTNGSPGVHSWRIFQIYFLMVAILKHLLLRRIKYHLWKQIRKSNVPTKIKCFTWQVCRRACLTRETEKERFRDCQGASFAMKRRKQIVICFLIVEWLLKCDICFSISSKNHGWCLSIQQIF